ncbi:hypothetical protein KI387_010876, partial [Taxus chinensis]
IRLGHLGRKDAKDAKRRSGRKEGQGVPFREVWKNLSQTTLGQVGHKYTADVGSRRSRGPIKSRHVSLAGKRTGKPESGGSEVFVPD